MYRPSSEDLLDVEVSAELRLTALPPGYPQLMARIQPNVTLDDTVDCYMFYVGNVANNAAIARQIGNVQQVVLMNVPLSPALDTTQSYRLVMSVKGQNPVTVTGEVDRWDGATWTSIGSQTVDDTDPARITAAGSVGFSGSNPESDGLYFYDNFKRTPL